MNRQMFASLSVGLVMTLFVMGSPTLTTALLANAYCPSPCK